MRALVPVEETIRYLPPTRFCHTAASHRGLFPPNSLSTASPLPKESPPLSKKLQKWDFHLPAPFAKDELAHPSTMAVQSKNLGNAADTPSSPSAATLLSTEQWQCLLLFSIFAAIRLHFACSNSYIHPDEHFQGPEVIIGMWTPCLPYKPSRLFAQLLQGTSLAGNHLSHGNLRHTIP